MAERSNLPAPYESPWRQLGRALQAVTASLGLDLRSLWRRNRSGELPRPPWWPRALAGLWWPLLLALVLALGGSALLALRPRAPLPVSSGAEPAPESPIPITSADTGPPQATVSTPGVDEGPQPSPTPPQTSPEQAPMQTQPDPLLEALTQGQDSALIATARVHAERGALVLQLAPEYGQRDPRRQRRLAETWLERSLQLGFEQLELVDANGQLLGYRARVGSGMILLESAEIS